MIAWIRIIFFIVANTLIALHYWHIEDKLVFQSIAAIHGIFIITIVFLVKQFSYVVALVNYLYKQEQEVRFKTEELTQKEREALNKYWETLEEEDGIHFLELRNINYFPFRVYPMTTEKLQDLINFASKKHS